MYIKYLWKQILLNRLRFLKYVPYFVVYLNRLSLGMAKSSGVKFGALSTKIYDAFIDSVA